MGSNTVLVAVHTASVNSETPYIPSAYWHTEPDMKTTAQEDEPDAKYHMEVVNTNGLTILGIGEDETPGEASRPDNIAGKTQ